MNSASPKTTWVDVTILIACRLGVGSLFIHSALLKMTRPYEFLSAVYGYQLLGPQTGLFLAVTLPVLELVVGSCLLTGWLLRGAALASILMSLLFSISVASVLSRGLTASCGCFGSDELITRATLLRSLFVLLLSSILLLRLGTLGSRRAVFRFSL